MIKRLPAAAAGRYHSSVESSGACSLNTSDRIKFSWSERVSGDGRAPLKYNQCYLLKPRHCDRFKFTECIMQQRRKPLCDCKRSERAHRSCQRLVSLATVGRNLFISEG